MGTRVVNSITHTHLKCYYPGVPGYPFPTLLYKHTGCKVQKGIHQFRYFLPQYVHQIPIVFNLNKNSMGTKRFGLTKFDLNWCTHFGPYSWWAGSPIAWTAMEKHYRKFALKVRKCRTDFCQTKTKKDNNGDPVLKIKPVRPLETGLKALGRVVNGSSLSNRSGLFPNTCQFLKFSNQTIIKEDMTILLKQG